MKAKGFTKAFVAAVGIATVFTVLGPVDAGARASSPSNSRAPSLLPQPTGTFSVGIRTVASVSPDATTRVWYPARPRTGDRAPLYLSSEVAADYGLPTDLLTRAVPRATVDAEPARAPKPRPAIVLMPGWGMPMALSTALAQDLASNGYVVVTVDPTFGTEDRMTLPSDTANPGRRLEQLSAALDFTAGTEITRLAGPVDHRRIAVGGHSIAGAVAFQTSLTDARVHAVVDLDGWLHGSALTTPIGVPALMLNASGLEPETRAIVDRSRSAVTVKLAGATHLDVTDLPCLIVPLPDATKSALGMGSIGCDGTATTDAVVVRFLDVVLRDGKPTPSANSLTHGLDRTER